MINLVCSRQHGKPWLSGIASVVPGEDRHGPDEGRPTDVHPGAPVAAGDVRGLLRAPGPVREV